MFGSHEIQIPSGYEAIVNGRFEEKRPLKVRTDDQVYFVTLAPSFTEVPVETPCKEGISHKITVTVKTRFQRANIAEILRDAGHSTYTGTTKVSAQELVARLKLLDSIKASVQTYVREAGFFDLAKQEQVRNALHLRIQSECTKVQLEGEVVSCDILLILPEKEEAFLAQLAARAGVKETADGGIKARKYSDDNLGAIYEYFLDVREHAKQIQLETGRQAELMKAEAERTKADAEMAMEGTKKQLEESRANVKRAQLEQADRVKEFEVELQKKDAERQGVIQELNAGIKESGANYEFQYKSKLLEEEMKLAKMRVDLAKIQEAEEEARLERRRKELELELERESKLAKIRAEEKTNTFTALGGLLEKIPTANYEGVRTLITGSGAGGAASNDVVSGMVLGLLSRAAEGVDIPSESNPSDGKKK